MHAAARTAISCVEQSTTSSIYSAHLGGDASRLTLRQSLTCPHSPPRLSARPCPRRSCQRVTVRGWYWCTFLGLQCVLLFLLFQHSLEVDSKMCSAGLVHRSTSECSYLHALPLPPSCPEEPYQGRLLHSNLSLFGTRSLPRPYSRGTLSGLFAFIFVSSTFTLVHAQAGAFTLNAPDPTPQQCASTTFSWTGGTPPYELLIKVHENDDALRDLNATSNSYTWDPIDFSSGSTLKAVVVDSTGLSTHPIAFTVGTGDGSTCLDQVRGSCLLDMPARMNSLL